MWVTAKGVPAATRDNARVERDKRVEAKPTGANAGTLGKRKDGGDNGTPKATKRKREDTPPRRMGSVDSEDEEDDEEIGRADMDG